MSSTFFQVLKKLYHATKNSDAYKAKYQSVLKGQKKTSRKIEGLTYHRNRFVENYLHNTSLFVVEYLSTNNIGTVVIGKNDNWKQETIKTLPKYPTIS